MFKCADQIMNLSLKDLHMKSIRRTKISIKDYGRRYEERLSIRLTKMFRLMFQHRTISRIKNKKINDRKVKNTVSLLTQFGDKHTYFGGYQARKEIH